MKVNQWTYGDKTFWSFLTIDVSSEGSASFKFVSVAHKQLII